MVEAAGADMAVAMVAAAAVVEEVAADDVGPRRLDGPPMGGRSYGPPGENPEGEPTPKA